MASLRLFQRLSDVTRSFLLSAGVILIGRIFPLHLSGSERIKTACPLVGHSHRQARSPGVVVRSGGSVRGERLSGEAVTSSFHGGWPIVTARPEALNSPGSVFVSASFVDIVAVMSRVEVGGVLHPDHLHVSIDTV